MRTQSTQLPRRFRPLRVVRGLSIGSVGAVMLMAMRVASAATITVDASTSPAGNPHFWSNTAGTGTASLTLRSDLQTHYQLANRELGFLHVRGHGVLNDDMGIYKGGGTYDFTKFDTYLNAIAAAGMRPSMELSFMPTALAKNGSSRDPAKDLTAYTALIKAVVQHCVDKFGATDVGQWNWEVWNEPNYSGFWNGTWQGTSNDYFTMYDAAVSGATSALPNILIGGPAATQGAASFLQAFLTHTKSANVRVSFVSSHAYCGDCKATLDANFGASDNDSRVSAIKAAGYTTDAIKSLNSEWNSSYGGQGGSTDQACVSMDTHVNAPFIIKAVKLLAAKNVGSTPPLDMFSYWVVSDVFDESSGPSGSYILSKTAAGTLPFGSVFGLTTFQGMRKAAYNGFRMLNYLGPKLLTSTGGSGTSDGVDVMAASSSTGDEVQIIVYNQYKTPATTGTDSVTLTVNNLPAALSGKSVYVTHFGVDETHSNPYSVWSSQSKPTAPTEAQWQAMRAAQHLALIEPVSKTTVTTSYSTTFTLAKQGAALIILGVNRPLTGRDALSTMEGEDYDGQSNATKEDSGDTSMGQSISVTSGGYLFFDNVDFSDAGVGSVQLRVKAASATTLELHADTQTGPLVGTCAITATGTAWATQTCTLTQTTGVHTLYVNFAGAAHLNWMQFQPSTCSGTSCGNGTGGSTSVSTGGSPGTTGGTTSAGGSKATGGVSSALGGTTSTAGGAKATGGGVATGGSSTNGGANGTGGVLSTNGGASAAGGTLGTTGGGINATGGVLVAVGGNATGGIATNAGGAMSTGGIASNVGGVMSTGGAPTVGGAGVVGGATSSGTSTGAETGGAANSDTGSCSCRIPSDRSSPLGTTGRLGFLSLAGLALLRYRRRRAR